MTTRRLLDLVIVASVSLWVTSLIVDPQLMQIMLLAPLALGYAFIEAGVPVLRRKLGAAPDPSAPERHRISMLLYLQGITVAILPVAAAVLAYSVMLHALVGRARWAAHAVGIAVTAAATFWVEPRGVAAWAPLPTLTGLAVWAAAHRLTRAAAPQPAPRQE